MGLDDQIFTLKFTAKQLGREAKRCEKDQAKEKLKIKKAVQQGNSEGAKIYASNAIRMRTQYLNYLRLQSKIDAVASKLSSQMRMSQATMAMGSIGKTLEAACKTMNLEQISASMERFEEQFENLEVQSKCVEDAMSSSTSQLTDPAEVDELIQQVCEEHNLEQAADLSLPVGESVGDKQAEDDLQRRLNELKQM